MGCWGERINIIQGKKSCLWFSIWDIYTSFLILLAPVFTKMLNDDSDSILFPCLGFHEDTLEVSLLKIILVNGLKAFYHVKCLPFPTLVMNAVPEKYRF